MKSSSTDFWHLLIRNAEKEVVAPWALRHPLGRPAPGSTMKGSLEWADDGCKMEDGYVAAQGIERC